MDCNANQLIAMSDQQLLEHFKQYLNVTRPEFAPKPKAPTNKPTSVASTPQFAKKVEQLKALGLDINISDFQKRKGKR